MTKAQTIRETLKSLKIKATQVGVKMGTGSSCNMAIMYVKDLELSSTIKEMFLSDENIYIQYRIGA